MQDTARTGRFKRPRLFLIGICLSMALDAVTACAAPPIDRFDGHRAWKADSVLASPFFDGRRSGSEGGTAAEEWIASQFQAAGLHPGSETGTYFQGFPVIGYREKKTSLELLDGPFGKIRFTHGDDYNLLLTPGSGNVTAEAVLVGYGIDAPEKGRNDYAGCDLAGKIAVILRGRPQDGQDWSKEYSRNHTFPAARKHGALAVLYYQREHPVAGAALSASAYDPYTPAGYISKRIVEILLRETGTRLEEIEEKLKDGPFPLCTGKRLKFKVSVRGEGVATARNVLGLLRGADPLLGTEVVIVGAHHDHIGFDAGKRLYGGANDNASGTSILLELARALHESGWTPRRSILFVTFGGEELGLLGSKHLAKNLPFDSTRVVAMINIDMAGHGDGGFGIAGGARFGPPYSNWRACLDSTRAAEFEEYRLEGGNSDHGPFAERGIPAATSWSRGDHHFYHDFEDQARYVSSDILEVVGRGVGSLVVALADHPEALADGFGWERTLRAGATQVSFEPIDSGQLIDPDRSVFGGEGRISGRLVAIDPKTSTEASLLRRLGRLTDLPNGRTWLHVAKEMKGLKEAWDQLGVALLPVAHVETLERFGWEATEALCAAGLAGAIWRVGQPPPAPEIGAALGRSGRFLIADGSVDWNQLLTRENDLKILLQRGLDSDLPSPPDSTYQERVMLVMQVGGIVDSTQIREAFDSWGEAHLHIDFAGGLENGVVETESLRFIAWLRKEGWNEEVIGALLGGNLRAF